MRHIYNEIDIERNKQNQKWGVDKDDRNSGNDWVAYIAKHIGRAVLNPWDLLSFRTQMIRVAALAVAAVEWCDRKAK